MNKSLLARGLGLGAVVCAGAGILGFAPAAQATPYTPPDVSVMAAGSDTTETMMAAIMANHDGQSITTSLGTGTLHTANLKAVPSSNINVTGDQDCPDATWTPGSLVYTPPPVQWVAPAGSSAGRDYLGQQESYAAGQKGCVDIARSSGNPRSQASTALEKSTFEYYAFALDAVTWASPSLKAPATLTKAQVKGIYNCTFTNWDQVGGTTGAIQRYIPQNGSGTRSFFLSAYGITSGDLATTSGSCPAVKETGLSGATPVAFEENQGATIAPVDIDKAVLPYSAAVWSYQFANRVNPTLDKRNGVRLGGMTTTQAVPVKGIPVSWNSVGRKYQLDSGAGGVVNEANVSVANPSFNSSTDYVGIRYVYNVLDNAGNLPGYQAASKLVGFDNSIGGAKSPLCDNQNVGNADGQFDYAAILSYGFAPLSTADPTGTQNLAGSTCRRVPLAP